MHQVHPCVPEIESDLGHFWLQDDENRYVACVTHGIIKTNVCEKFRFLEFLSRALVSSLPFYFPYSPFHIFFLPLSYPPFHIFFFYFLA